MRIGFIGLGNMGGPMALNVLKAGHTMVVNDIRRDMAAPHVRQGATWAETPKAVAEQSELVFTSLPGPREVEAVALGEHGIIEGAAPGAIYADLSTSSATLIRRIHGIFRETGMHVLDAPVSGGASGARRASLAVLVGGDEALYQHIKPVLDAIGDKVTYIGEIGCGTIAKIVHNMVSLCSRVAIAEGLTLRVKTGVSPRALLDALQRGSFGQGRVLKESIPNGVFKGDFDTVGFALKLSRKDLGLATDLAKEYHVPMMVAGLVEQQLEEALRRGLAEKDSSAIFLLQEERAGVQVRDPQVS
jgi:3-hydroxyisobutyrate dehydrogenase-like beta-hydroxyacid dehydrogenase